MPLGPLGPDYADVTGTLETITIQPIPPALSTQVFFTAASYGRGSDGTSLTVPGVAGKTSLTFEVLEGPNRLLFGLASALPQLQSVNIMQGSTLLSTVSVEFHSGTGSLRIVGTPAPAALGGRNR